MIFGPYPATLTGIHDGDTVSVDIDLGFGVHATSFKARIFGINAPELASPEGKAARDFLAQAITIGSPLRVTSHGWDKYGGRFDAAISYGPLFEQDLAQLMLSSGHAVPLSVH